MLKLLGQSKYSMTKTITSELVKTFPFHKNVFVQDFTHYAHRKNMYKFLKVI